MLGTKWKYTRIPTGPEATAVEAGGSPEETLTGDWEPFAYDPRGEWLFLRKKLTLREKIVLFLEGKNNATTQAETTGVPAAVRSSGRSDRRVPMRSTSDASAILSEIRASALR